MWSDKYGKWSVKCQNEERKNKWRRWRQRQRRSYVVKWTPLTNSTRYQANANSAASTNASIHFKPAAKQTKQLKKDRQKWAACKLNKTAVDRSACSQFEIFSRSDRFKRSLPSVVYIRLSSLKFYFFGLFVVYLCATVSSDFSFNGLGDYQVNIFVRVHCFQENFDCSFYLFVLLLLLFL